MEIILFSSVLLCCYIFAECAWTPFDYPAIQGCQMTPLPGSKRVSLLCRLRTINSELEVTNFSVIPPLQTSKLKIECNNNLFFQSSLQNKSFYHLTNLEDLNIRYCKIGIIPPRAFMGLINLKNLSLETFNSERGSMSLKISPGAFRDQKKLEQLTLTHNNIWTLPPKLFCQLEYLTYLNMSRNKLQNIENLSFGNYVNKCVPRLRFLDISYNSFLTLPSFSFEALKNLTTLNISKNGIRNIADQAFFGMYSLEVLDISANQLSTLPPELFKENKRLTKFYARNNSITVLAPGLFSGLDMLLELDLSQNKLTNTWVNSETFINLIRLATLDLSYNKINRLDVATFRDLTNLQILNLQYNIIQYVADYTFSGLFRLHTLLLSNNMLKKLGQYTLMDLPSLTDLALNNNNISRVNSEALLNSTLLKHLYLKNNSLNEAPSVIRKLPQLKILDLSTNQITTLSNTSFQGLSNLNSLYLDNNFIKRVGVNSFAPMSSLQVLNCANNQLEYLENGAFDRNPDLRAIRIDHNKLTNIYGLFTNLSGLRWLNVSQNHLKIFDYAFIPKELEYLDLRHNYLNELENYFKIENQLHLKVLDVSFNKLRNVNASSIPDSVENLFLNNNLISNVQPYTFLKKGNLKRVDLFANEIRKIDKDALRLPKLDPLKPLPEFYLAENPFECDCTFEWLQTVNVQEEPHQTPRVVDLTSIMCRLFSRRGPNLVPLLEAQKLQFLCPYESHCFPQCHCCDFDACDCEMTCPLGCTCFHDKSWTANVVDCSSSYLEDVPGRIPMDASEVYLDGNKVSSLSSHTFIGRKNLRVLYLNASHINEIYNRTFNGLRKLKILYLNDNNISLLKGFEFEHLNLLKELYLHNNRIKTIYNSTFVTLLSLEILRLDNNLLSTLSVKQFSENLLLKHLWLGNNLWSCACPFVEILKEWVEDGNNIIVDKNNLYCILNTTFNQRIHISSYNEPCGVQNLTTNFQFLYSHDYLFFPTISLGICALLLTVILVIFCNRAKMRVWMYAKYGIRLFQKKENEDDTHKLFDAFVSYSSKDEVFVTQILAPELERGSPSYKLCLHYRDFPVGAYVCENITGAVEMSRRTILVLSENFVKSEWSRFDFRTAHHDVLRERQKRLIVILLGEVPQRELDPDLRLYLKTNTFLKWGDNRFWEKLKYAMPDAKPPTRNHPLTEFNQQQSSTEQGQPQQHSQTNMEHHQQMIFAQAMQLTPSTQAPARGHQPPPAFHHSLTHHHPPTYIHHNRHHVSSHM